MVSERATVVAAVILLSKAVFKGQMIDRVQPTPFSIEGACSKSAAVYIAMDERTF